MNNEVRCVSLDYLLEKQLAQSGTDYSIEKNTLQENKRSMIFLISLLTLISEEKGLKIQLSKIEEEIKKMTNVSNDVRVLTTTGIPNSFWRNWKNIAN